MSALSERGRDERIARMALSIVAAPDDPATGQLVRRVGAAETLRLADSDGPVPGMDRIETGVWRDRIRSKGSPDQVTLQVAQLERSSFEALIPGDAVWPTAVDDLGDRAPYALWARGSTELLGAALSDRVTLTGARAATAYGEHVAGELAGRERRRRTCTTGRFPCLWRRDSRSCHDRRTVARSCSWWRSQVAAGLNHPVHVGDLQAAVFSEFTPYDSICYMDDVRDTVKQLHSQAQAADELHERSRSLLVDAVRSGVAAGLTQREIAGAINRSQPEVSRLLRFQGRSGRGRTLARNRSKIIALAAARGAANLRVFGSVALGTDTAESDIDLIADIAPGTGLFTLARLEHELSELLGAEVDVVPAKGLREHLAERVLNEAVPL